MTTATITEAVFNYLNIPNSPQAARLISLLASKHKIKERAARPTLQELSDMETIEGNFLTL